ncbi:LAMI_0H04786g1_1 [Lachancea mirantina]|uniref:LAMI_0H04786g1_1 n=1 Tax=Lachancea mirantina TaxID=1230905 RepID=A0A1G4KEU4_9SACH|nr:LAMI_0H04786g1_1 [Lachancea mirantina]
MTSAHSHVTNEKTSLSDTELKLPRQIFKRRIQHEWAERKVLMISRLLLYVASLSLLIYSAAVDNFAMMLPSYFGIALFVFAGIFFSPYRALTVHDKMLFMEEVLEVNPRLDMEKWDVVAAQSNHAMFAEGSRKNPYFFFDGESCHQLFQTFVNSYAKEMKVDQGQEPRGNIVEQAATYHLQKLTEKWTQMSNNQ